MDVGVIVLYGELLLDGRASRCVMGDRNKLEPPKVGEFTRNRYIQSLIRIRNTPPHPPAIRLSSVLMKVFRFPYVYRLLCLSLRRLKKLKVLFYPMRLSFRKSTAFCKIPSLLPFVPLVTATCTWKWVWNFGGMILTAVNRNIDIKTLPFLLRLPQIPHGLAWERTRGSTARGQRPTAWAILSLNLTCTVFKF